MRNYFRRSALRLCLLILTVSALSISAATAQITVHPSIGVQTMWFNGANAIKQPISPGADRELPLGGGMNGTHPGLQLQLDLLPSSSSMFRFPILVEAYSLVGKTTFAASQPSEPRKKRWLFRHSAEVYSIGAGITVNLTESFPRPYISAVGKANFIGTSDLLSRIYYFDNNETVTERTVHPDTVGKTRFGAYIKIGTQLEFFEPLLLDFSIGYGALNILGKETDPEQQRNLLVVDNLRRDPESTVGYIGVGLSIIWKL